MKRPPQEAGRPGAPRTPAAGERLATFERRMEAPLVLAAVVPIVLNLADHRPVLVGSVYVASWLIFLVDFLVHQRLTVGYLRRARGRFDLAVVVLTAPWFFIPGFATSRFFVVVRLARLVRMVVATRAARRLVERLGRAAVLGAAMVLLCSYVAYQVENPDNPGFGTFGDALWWGVVTVTTVGYGDIVPRTASGRWIGALLMVTGIGIIGALAGSLASFLRLTPAGPSPASPPREETDAPSPPAETSLSDQIGELRQQLARIEQRLSELGPPSGRVADDS